MAEKKYKTAAALRRACKAYFQSISRTVVAREMVNTGKKDKYGHDIFEPRDIKNDKGELIKYTEYATPPSITALCLYLGISPETWRRYISSDEQWRAVGVWVRTKIRAYLLRESLVRTKGIQGVLFNLTNNYSDGEDVAVESEERDSGRGVIMMPQIMPDISPATEEVGDE